MCKWLPGTSTATPPPPTLSARPWEEEWIYNSLSDIAPELAPFHSKKIKTISKHNSQGISKCDTPFWNPLIIIFLFSDKYTSVTEWIDFLCCLYLYSIVFIDIYLFLDPSLWTLHLTYIMTLKVHVGVLAQDWFLGTFRTRVSRCKCRPRYGLNSYIRLSSGIEERITSAMCS